MPEKNDLEILRHSCAHLLAAAVKELYPQAKFTIGPAIENGFYYDFDLEKPLTPDDLRKIEAKMQELSSKDLKFEKSEMPVKEAIKLMEKEGQKYKVELLKDLDTEKATFYKTGDFLDLCKGPHVKSTKEIKYFKLLKVAGAYWRGDEKNKMLQRVYGTCWPTKEELDEYLKKIEEAKKHDHRKIGQDLDLFTFSDYVGAGLPLFTPKGTIVRNQLYNRLLEISKKYGVLPVTIPHLAKIKLYELSGHAEKFAGELFKVISHYKEEFVLKPVNCPHHTQIYASRQRSYRDLPIRYMETTMMYRDEKPGEIGGLTRVRSITCDDGHTFCTLGQIKQEAINTCKIIEEFYKSLDMFDEHWVSLSLRDPKTPEKYIGEPKDWDHAEKMLEEISQELKLDAKKMEGEAALYGPKLDYMFKDSLGNDRQLATVQLDFSMPKRFGLFYIDEKGTKQTPVMLHRAILGSYERFLAILLERFDGAFPVWLAPVQAIILPVSDKHLKYAQKVADDLADCRVEVDERNESVGKKIRDAELQKIPYIIVVGDKEEKDKNITVRTRGSKDLKTQKIEEFLKELDKGI